MDDRLCGDDAGKEKRTDDDGKQDHEDRLLHRPKRRDVGRIEQVLRGKMGRTAPSGISVP